MAGRPNPFAHRRSTAKGWSIYGAQRAQPVATGGKSGVPKKRSNKPIRNRYGKEGVDGSSSSEGFRKFLLISSFRSLAWRQRRGSASTERPRRAAFVSCAVSKS